MSTGFFFVLLEGGLAVLPLVLGMLPGGDSEDAFVGIVGSGVPDFVFFIWLPGVAAVEFGVPPGCVSASVEVPDFGFFLLPSVVVSGVFVVEFGVTESGGVVSVLADEADVLAKAERTLCIAGFSLPLSSSRSAFFPVSQPC